MRQLPRLSIPILFLYLSIIGLSSAEDSTGKTVRVSYNDTSQFEECRCQCTFRAEDVMSDRGWLQLEVQLTTNTLGITNRPTDSPMAAVYWKLTLDLLNTELFGEGCLELKYLDREIAGMNEDRLIIYHADKPDGPWRRVPTEFAIDKTRNIIKAKVGRMGYFIICEEPIPENTEKITVGLDLKITETQDCKIQNALDRISPGGTIKVKPGIYHENLVFPHWNDGSRKGITLTSTDPDDYEVVQSTIIDGDYRDAVIKFHGGETPQTVVKGFTICNGFNVLKCGGGGILGQGTHATITKNNIVNNKSHYYGGGVSDCDGLIEYNAIAFNSTAPFYRAISEGGGMAFCDGKISFNTIYRNQAFNSNGMRYSGFSAGSSYGGLFRCKAERITNSIIWANIAHHDEQIDDRSTLPEYCCIEKWGKRDSNVSTDPCIIGARVCDFSIKKGVLDFEAGCGGSYDAEGLMRDVNPYLELKWNRNETGPRCVILDWSSYPDDSVTYFDLYRSNHSQGAFLKVNVKPIPGKTKRYVIHSQGGGIYIVRGIGMTTESLNMFKYKEFIR